MIRCSRPGALQHTHRGCGTRGTCDSSRLVGTPWTTTTVNLTSARHPTQQLWRRWTGWN